MKNSNFIKIVLGIMMAACMPTISQTKPNILWLTVEDISDHQGSYGYTNARTPNLDQMAAEGVQYDNGFATAPVCAVARSSILTGVYSPSQGSHHMRNDADLGNGIEPYVTYMEAAGYHCTNPGKTDYQGIAAKSIWSTGSYLDRADKSKPFLHVDNHTGTHESQNRRDFGSFDPDALTPPPYYPNTRKVREFWASYYKNIADMDTWIGQKLTELENSGEAANTIVVYYSDHGVGFPRGKRWMYDSGLKVPWIIKMPAAYRRAGKDVPNTKTDELISFIDLAPTILNLAGAQIPAHMQGQAVLGPNTPAERKYIYAARDRMDERRDIMRVVRDKRYFYKRNYEYFKPNQQFNGYPELNAWSGIMEEIRRVYGEPNPPAEIAWYFQTKPTEELYDSQTDPHHMTDLARNPLYADKLNELRQAHLQWRDQIRDLGSVPELIINAWDDAYGNREYDLGLGRTADIKRAWEVLDSLHLLSTTQFLALLQDPNDAVRYWAAVGLGINEDNASSVISALNTALNDPVLPVQIAAAKSLLMLGNSQAALNVLSTGLNHSDTYVRLAAIQAADELGTKAASLQSDIQGVAQGNVSYVHRVRDRAIATIGDAPDPSGKVTLGCPDTNYVEYLPTRWADDMRLCQTRTTIQNGVKKTILLLEQESNQIKIDLGDNQFIQVKVYDLNGELIYQNDKLQAGEKIFTKNWNKGLYLFLINFNGNLFHNSLKFNLI